MSDIMHAVPLAEVRHYHAYHEYYIVLKGRGILWVGGSEVSLEEQSIVMVAPREVHRLAWVDPDLGLQLLVIKEQSAPDSKIIVPDPERNSDTTPSR